jgi:hypothetical protein
VVAQLGDVVDQLATATGGHHADCQRSGPGFESGIPHSLLNGARNYDCVSKTSLRVGGVPA